MANSLYFASPSHQPKPQFWLKPETYTKSKNGHTFGTKPKPANSTYGELESDEAAEIHSKNLLDANS